MIDYYNLPLPRFNDAIKNIDNFMMYQKIRGLSCSTISVYEKEAINFFSIIDPKFFSKKYLNNYLSDFGDISTGYYNVRVTSLRTILKHLVKIGFDNCSLKIYTKKSSSKLPDFVSEQEMKSKIRKLSLNKTRTSSIWQGRRDYALFMFMYATGLRASEVSRFKREDLQNGWIRVENGKGGKDRYVPIASSAVKALEDYYKYLPARFKDIGTFFISNGLNSFNRTTLHIHCQNVFGMKPHLFRHTFATHLAINGCDVNVLADFLGHSSLSTTQIYLNIQNQYLKNTVNFYHPLS